MAYEMARHAAKVDGSPPLLKVDRELKVGRAMTRLDGFGTQVALR